MDWHGMTSSVAKRSNTSARLTLAQEVFGVLPIGFENRLSADALLAKLDGGRTRGGVKKVLRRLAARKLIMCSVERARCASGFRSLFFKEDGRALTDDELDGLRGRKQSKRRRASSPRRTSITSNPQVRMIIGGWRYDLRGFSLHTLRAVF